MPNKIMILKKELWGLCSKCYCAVSRDEIDFHKCYETESEENSKFRPDRLHPLNWKYHVEK